MSNDAAAKQLPTGEEKARVVTEMFDRISERYDLVNKLMTFGLDKGWRRQAMDCLGLGSGSLLLDVACGTGDLSIEAAKRGMRAIGIDLSDGMLQVARHRTAALPTAAASRLALIRCDAGSIPLPDASLDGAVSGFALRNFVAIGPVLGELARVVRPGGRIALLDVDTPTLPVVSTVHGFWFRHGAPALGRLLSDPRAYDYLPRSLAYLPPSREIASSISAAGFESVVHKRLTFGTVQLFCATRAGG
jgi:demethylmenaquinone methyltransferase/2-methoxy-6-polyprenyl-1,4-benzoquinol methylase